MSNVNRFSRSDKEYQRQVERELVEKFYGPNAVQKVIAARQAPPAEAVPEKKRSIRRKFGRGKG